MIGKPTACVGFFVEVKLRLINLNWVKHIMESLTPHSLENIDSKPFKCLIIEMKDRPYAEK